MRLKALPWLAASVYSSARYALALGVEIAVVLDVPDALDVPEPHRI